VTHVVACFVAHFVARFVAHFITHCIGCFVACFVVCFVACVLYVTGLYPTGNLDKRFNGTLKGGKNYSGLIGVNVGLDSFYNEKMDLVAAYIAWKARGVGVLYPKHPCKDDVAMALLMTQVDVHECSGVQRPEGNTIRCFFYCNQAHQIGLPITTKRIDEFERGCEGDLDYFVRLVQDEEEKVGDRCQDAFEYQMTEDICDDKTVDDDPILPDEERNELADLLYGGKSVDLSSQQAEQLIVAAAATLKKEATPLTKDQQHARWQCRGACRMIQASLTLCKSEIQDGGVVIGRCEKCYKRIACNGTTFIKSLHGLLPEGQSLIGLAKLLPKA
jgi:hypothetical protein